MWLQGGGAVNKTPPFAGPDRAAGSAPRAAGRRAHARDAARRAISTATARASRFKRDRRARDRCADRGRGLRLHPCVSPGIRPAVRDAGPPAPRLAAGDVSAPVSGVLWAPRLRCPHPRRGVAGPDPQWAADGRPAKVTRRTNARSGAGNRTVARRSGARCARSMLGPCERPVSSTPSHPTSAASAGWRL